MNEKNNASILITMHFYCKGLGAESCGGGSKPAIALPLLTIMLQVAGSGGGCGGALLAAEDLCARKPLATGAGKEAPV